MSPALVGLIGTILIFASVIGFAVSLHFLARYFVAKDNMIGYVLSAIGMFILLAAFGLGVVWMCDTLAP